MKYILTILLLLISPLSVAEKKDNADLTQFDYPFLLGSWKFPNAAVKVTFFSDYSYFIEMYDELGMSTEYGKYEYQNENLIFYSNQGKIRKYEAEFNYQMLLLEKVPFTKMPKLDLLGVWRSRDVYVESNANTNKVEISFNPDFIFRMIVKSNSKEKETLGIYTIERNKILLTTESGQVTGDIAFRDDMMILDLENGDFTSSLIRR